MSVRNRVLETVAKIYGANMNDIDDSDELSRDLGGDSIDNFDLHFRLEKEFEITIPDEDAEELKTVGDVVQTVESFLV